MELFSLLFGDLLAFVYHCFDRIVIYGLPERAVTTRAGRALLPSSGRGTGSQQGGPQPTYRRLSELGGSLRPQSSDHDRMGREGGAQGRPCPAVATPHDNERRLRRLFHPQEHGTGSDLSRHGAEIHHQGSKLPDPCAPAQPFHALLLLHPRRGSGPDGDAGGLVLPVPDHLLPQWSQFHRAGAEPSADKRDRAFWWPGEQAF